MMETSLCLALVSRILVGAGLWALGIAGEVNAQPVPVLPQVSTFDAGTDGWSVSGVATRIEPAGGNPGGFVFGQGQATEDPPRISPPARYRGDWRPLEGCAALMFDHRIIDPRGLFCGTFPYTVEISGPGGVARWTGPLPPQTVTPWIRFSVPIDRALWAVESGEWEAMLANVTDIFIAMELFCNMQSPDDQSGLDNIVLRSTLEGDVGGDGLVGLSDIAAIITAWGIMVPPGTGADLDDSGDVGLGDIAVVIQNWGASCV